MVKSVYSTAPCPPRPQPPNLVGLPLYSISGMNFPFPCREKPWEDREVEKGEYVCVSSVVFWDRVQRSLGEGGKAVASSVSFLRVQGCGPEPQRIHEAWVSDQSLLLATGHTTVYKRGLGFKSRSSSDSFEKTQMWSHHFWLKLPKTSSNCSKDQGQNLHCSLPWSGPSPGPSLLTLQIQAKLLPAQWSSHVCFLVKVAPFSYLLFNFEVSNIISSKKTFF